MQMPVKFYSTVTQYFVFRSRVCSSHLCSLKYSLFGRHVFFILFMLIMLEIVHTFVSMHDAKAYEVLSDSHIFLQFYLSTLGQI